MAIPIPTVDDFQESTVMLVIRKIVDYIKDSLVPDINKADVANITTSISGQNLTINIVLGDGTVKSTTVVLPEGGGGESGPYPTGVTLSLSGTTLNFNMSMSNGTPITGSVNLAPILEGYATDAEVTSIQSDLQEQITGLKLSSDNNNITLNGDSVPIVKTVGGSVSNGNLKITVNGVESGDIPLPESSEEYVFGEYTYSGSVNFTSYNDSVKACMYNGQLPDTNVIYIGDNIPAKIIGKYYRYSSSKVGIYYVEDNALALEILQNVIPSNLPDGNYSLIISNVVSGSVLRQFIIDLFGNNKTYKLTSIKKTGNNIQIIGTNYIYAPTPIAINEKYVVSYIRKEYD